MPLGSGIRYASNAAPAKYLTYMLRSKDKRPRSGINALTLSPDDVRVFTAGRDGLARAWRVDAPAEPEMLFNEHSDWVNDVVLLSGVDRLVTASSDTTVRVWNTADGRVSLRTLVEHDDYVKALSPLADGAVVSGSLDGRVLVWDLAMGKVRAECGAEAGGLWRGGCNGFGTGRNGSNGGAGSAGMNSGGSCSSVYCLASCVETQASLVVSGSTDRVITVCDARSGETVVRLRGHTDAIRCLTLKHDGTLLLSGSSDGTVRMWDLRQQRCMRTYDAHSSDSVWALDAPRAFESFISGGRDGSVWHTSLDGDYASLVVDVADPVKWNNMVLDVALCRNDERRVWVSTTGSTVRQWLVPAVNSALNEGRRPAEPAVGSHGQTRPATESSPSNVVSNGTGEVKDHERPAQRRPGGSDAIDRHTFGGTRGPVVELQGLAGIIGYRIMNNRRYVMTCDTFEEVNIWDVTSASHVKSLGRLQEGTDLDAMLGKHDEQLSVPSWFKVDIRLGSLAIKLSKNSVGDAEVYAVDAGLEAETEEVKINIGDHVLRGLLSAWKTNLKRGADSGAHDGALENLRQAYESGDKNADSGREVAAAPAWAALKPYKFPPETLIVLSDDSPIPLLTKEAGEFEGEAETPVLPPWAVDVVREGNTMGREVAPKVGFTLYPVEGSGLPGLSTVNLTAPQVLRTRKVAQYVAKELAAVLELSASFKLEPHHIDILCHGKVVPPTMNLATTKKFMWQSEGTGDLVLAFRKAADTPATISAAIAAAAAAATARSQT